MVRSDSQLGQPCPFHRPLHRDARPATTGRSVCRSSTSSGRLRAAKRRELSGLRSRGQTCLGVAATGRGPSPLTPRKKAVVPYPCALRCGATGRNRRCYFSDASWWQHRSVSRVGGGQTAYFAERLYRYV